MATILITGGAGFIGSHLADYLLVDPKNRVVIMDDLSTGRSCHIPVSSRVDFLKIDVNDMGGFAPAFRRYRFDYVFHFAAVVGVERTQQNPHKVYSDIDGIRNVLRLCVEGRVRRVFYASSSEVYGASSDFPQIENRSALNCRHPYAIVKLTGETCLRAAYQAHGLEFTAFRFFNTYGPRQRADFVVPRFTEQALTGRDMTVHSEGSQTRTFCYVADTVSVVGASLKTGACCNQVVNVGSPVEVSIGELAARIRKEVKSRSRIVFKATPAGFDTLRRQPDVSRMRRFWKKDFTPLTCGLREVARYLRTEKGVDMRQGRFREADDYRLVMGCRRLIPFGQ